jgi:hypothetical protein
VASLSNCLILKFQKRSYSFFSEYTFITNQLRDRSLVSIPAAPTRINVKPFSTEEIETINAYKEHYREMYEREKIGADAG